MALESNTIRLGLKSFTCGVTAGNRFALTRSGINPAADLDDFQDLFYGGRADGN